MPSLTLNAQRNGTSGDRFRPRMDTKTNREWTRIGNANGSSFVRLTPDYGGQAAKQKTKKNTNRRFAQMEEKTKIAAKRRKKHKNNPPPQGLPPSSLVPETMADKTARQAADVRKSSASSVESPNLYDLLYKVRILSASICGSGCRRITGTISP
jgi:hypothetical protein